MKCQRCGEVVDDGAAHYLDVHGVKTADLSKEEWAKAVVDPLPPIPPDQVARVARLLRHWP